MESNQISIKRKIIIRERQTGKLLKQWYAVNIKLDKTKDINYC